MAVFVGVAAVAAGVATASAGSGVETPALRLAVNMTTIESAPIFLAAERAVDVPIQLSAGGIPQLVDHTADAATNSETQALLRSATAPNLRIVLTVAECYYRIVARRSAGIRSLADLRGKKVGTPASTSAHYFLVRMLATAKVAETDVTVLPMAVNAMGAAMRNHEVDAVSGWEPGAQDSIDALGRDAVVFQDRAVYRELFNLNTTTEVLNDPQRRAALVSAVRAIVMASKQVHAKPSTVWPLLSSKINVREPTIAATWRHFTFAGALPGDVLGVLTEEERWVAAVQRRSPRSRQDLQLLIDPTVLRDALSPAPSRAPGH
jgi:NitT/TauT family transport system substrate-binding protein